MNINKIANFILNKIPEKPKTAVILGSGLGSIIQTIKEPIYIKYNNIPGHPFNSVHGHKSEWVFGYMNEEPILFANGRFHIYEGCSLNQVTITVDIPYELECKKLLISNSAGCLNNSWDIGDFMIIDGYIDYTFQTSSNIPSIYYFKQNYPKIHLINKISKKLKLNVRHGIYAWTLGPNYETPSEVIDIINLGGHAVGMSTIPELKKANELNIPTMGISCFTNYAAGLVEENLNHNSVVETAYSMKDKFISILKELI